MHGACSSINKAEKKSHALISSINKTHVFQRVTSRRKRKTVVPRSMAVEALMSCETRRWSQPPARRKPRVSLASAPGILPVRRSRLALVETNLAVVRNQLSFPKPPRSRLCLSLSHKGREGFTTPLARRRSIYPLSSPNLVLTAYSPDSTCSNTLARATAPHQAFRDSITCLSHATRSRRTPYWRSGEAHLVQPQPSCHRLSTNRLTWVDSQLVSPREGESGLTPAVKDLLL